LAAKEQRWLEGLQAPQAEREPLVQQAHRWIPSGELGLLDG